jgi:hypothetical protein
MLTDSLECVKFVAKAVGFPVVLQVQSKRQSLNSLVVIGFPVKQFSDLSQHFVTSHSNFLWDM